MSKSLEHTAVVTIEDGQEVAVPVSAGIPPLVKLAAVIGVFLVFVVASLVLGASGFGHVWPSSDSPLIVLK